VAVDQAARHRDARANVELDEEPGQVHLHGASAQEQPGGDVLVGQAACDQVGDLALTEGPDAPAADRRQGGIPAA
jgi:hypothetical protein